jgi:hypothetical protein
MITNHHHEAPLAKTPHIRAPPVTMCNPFKKLTSKPTTKRPDIYIPKPPGMSGAEAFLISGPAPRKKLRVVCVSDTHNSSPKDGVFKVPPGDVLIHAGDMTNQGSYSELKRVVDWIGDCPHEVKLVIAGMFGELGYGATNNNFGSSF